MIQKVLRVGTSAAVTIPKRSMFDLGISLGDQVRVETDRVRKVLSVRPLRATTKADERIARLALDFINRYRADFEALAKK